MQRHKAFSFNFFSFFVLLFTLGFPRIPGTEFPLFILIAPLYFFVIIRTLKNNLRPFCFFFILFFCWFFWSLFCWLNSDEASTSDLFFLVVLASKFILGGIGGIVFFYIVQKNVRLLFWWVIIQLVIVLCSSFNESIYMMLLQFISPRSASIFENIYGLRALGFGVYHLDGAILLVFSLIFLAVTSKSINKKILVYLGGAIALLMSRSALIPLFLYTYLNSGILKLILIGAGFLMIGWGVSYLEGGIIFEAFELFVNLYEGKGLSTRSTDALAHMVIVPEDINTYIIGDGMFYNPVVPGFYMGTDIGYMRIFYFSGLTGVCLFIILNLYFCWYVYRNSKNLAVSKLALLLTFLVLIMNVKGLFVVLLMTTFLLCINRNLYSWRY